MKIRWICNTGFAGCNYEDEIEIKDDATDEEIEEMVKEEIFNYFSWSWCKVAEP